ncbi:MAG: hypothetical protein SZ59_C0006G0025 [candidate division TM6 bacterium GW2011_GWF2_28_16]|nr:MAG: hypothetical protein SZ59_C0006G0025 [candidate division TM6 bacterium GW2011_GWF2_28_16]
MKFKFVLKTVLVLTCALTISNTYADKSNRQSKYQKHLISKFDMVTDAVNDINKINTQIHPYKICKTYKIAGSNTLEEKTVIHYAEYRKKPDTSKKTIKTNTSVLQANEISFVYNSKKDKNHVMQTSRNPKIDTRIALNQNSRKA